MGNPLQNIFQSNLWKVIEDCEEEEAIVTDLLLSRLQDETESSSPPRPMYTRPYTGRQYVVDILEGHPIRSYNCFRLPAAAFIQLRDMLVRRGLLADTRNMTAAEQLAVFLRGIAHAHCYRQICEFFQHSLETVSRHFNNVFKGIVSLADEYIQLPPIDTPCHPLIQNNIIFHPFFKGAIGAIDGTHVPAIVPQDSQNRYRNRKGFTSQNVMAAVSFDRQFLYVAAGWEGSAADMRVMRWALEDGGFRVPHERYFLVDSGYANTSKLLAPFRGYRYHLSDYQRRSQRRYNNRQEMYNHRHAQLRNVVERTFGIWKERFQILTLMRQFPLQTQKYIVISCAILHNFIARYHGDDMYFNMTQSELSHDRGLGEVDEDCDDPQTEASIGERIQGELLRNIIATDIWTSSGDH